MKNVYTVKQLNSYIKNMFEQDFMLNRIYVKGEISNCKYHTSGHIYFSLKDESGTISCVMFAGSRSGLSFRLEEGICVVVLGSVDVYVRDGKYQLYAKEIIRDGTGELYEKFEALKKELSEMGMFAQEYKKQIPRYSHTVGIVTAPTGAAVKDIINIARRRNPFVQLLIYPAQVQGTGAAESIAKGIQELEKKNPDVIIIGRGGGSIEDLWAFNEEIVARAVFNCNIPVISAVGHETDTTISDYVADLRAPTPSAAAELAVFDYREVKERIRVYNDRILRDMNSRISAGREAVKHLQLRMKMAHPQRKLNDAKQRTADLETRLRTCMEVRFLKEKHRLALLSETFRGLSPLQKLTGGYAYVRTSEGKNVKSISQTEKGDRIEVFLSDGMLQAEILSCKPVVYPCSDDGICNTDKGL